MTSRECHDLSIEEAPSYILGYTIGNDLSCRFFQLPKQSGGQFFYAKAFDRFAPVGPVLVHPSVWHKAEKTARLVTRVNGHVKQDSHLSTDMINTPARILSWMSQGKSLFSQDSRIEDYEQNGLIFCFRHHNSRVYDCYDGHTSGSGRIPDPSAIPQG